MPDDFAARLSVYADLVLRIGVNLQPGQRLLLADPYEHHGVPAAAAPLVESVTDRARQCGASRIDVLWSDPAVLASRPGRALKAHLQRNAEIMQQYVERGDALLFLLDGPPAEDAANIARAAAMRRLAWEYFGPVAQQLITGATNWCVVPIATPVWAAHVFSTKPANSQLNRLWTDIFRACRLDVPDPHAAWKRHLQGLAARCDELNGWRHRTWRLTGPGTSLVVSLPSSHVWKSAAARTRVGLPFVANLPTEETFTLPDKDSAEGVLHVARPLSYGGALIEGVDLTFQRGRVVRATARHGQAMLEKLLATDEGAARLGEIALVPSDSPLGRIGRHFFHPLLDENASNHVALGQAYKFNLRGGGEMSARAFAAAGGNESLVHVDLAIDGEWSPVT